MDISEQVLTSTLAQLVQKDVTEVGKKAKQEQKAFEIVKSEGFLEAGKVDVLGNVEREIIKILLLYGNHKEVFDDVLMKANEDGEIKPFIEKKEYKVFNKIYLSLQEDEIDFTTVKFKEIYHNLINFYLKNDNFSLEQYLMHLQPEFAQEVTDILMEDEKYLIHNWEGQEIFPKTKAESLLQYVSDVLFTLRWFLLSEIVNNFKNSLSNESDADNSEILGMTMDYNKLKNDFSRITGRVVVPYH
jgi:DNA primase